eukprot:CAMPEP_0119569042 /NCGR_PEP_ID=MMETSP1352-20130426/40552_1 /TAXON_ID=265584 /ORGANISM="Stauroneis constricta, Strain CCMP1120" /LENGTH=543 /DNA_ID=CAMNT_0007618541 /DNA_START=465 /DNA_END=2096 /DNA_ORIENTATION=+
MPTLAVTMAMAMMTMTAAMHMMTASSTSLVVEAYATALPKARQSAWLKQITADIRSQPLGELTDEDIASIPRIMKGWTARPNHAQSTENAVAVERLLKRVVDERAAGNKNAIATTEDYNCLLEGWAKSRGGAFAAQRCESIVRQMEHLYHEKGDDHVQPNLCSFKTMLMAWRHAEHNQPSKARNSNGHDGNDAGNESPAIHSQRILEWMVQLHQSGKNEQALPDSDCFDIVLQIWSHSSDENAPIYAEQLLGAMERLHRETGAAKLSPKTTSFNAVLAAWMRSKSDQAPRRVIEILSFMDHLYHNEGNRRVKPDAYSYSTIISTLGQQADEVSASKAELILRRLLKQHREGVLDWDLDAVLFNSAINCWTRSDVSGAFRYARSILDRQITCYEQGCDTATPDVFGFTSVISSCASEPGNKDRRQKAFDVATQTYQQLQQRSHEFGRPNHVTYGTMLKACIRLLPQNSKQRRQWVKKVIDECIQSGHVGEMVLSRLREATTHAEFQQLLRGHKKNDLPVAWTANVNERSSYRRGPRQNRRSAEV